MCKKQGMLSTSTSVLNLVTADHSDTSARDWAVFKESNISFPNGYFYTCTSADQKVVCP